MRLGDLLRESGTVSDDTKTISGVAPHLNAMKERTRESLANQFRSCSHKNVKTAISIVLTGTVLVWVATKGVFAIDTATTVLIYGLAACGLAVSVRYAHLLDGGHGIYFAGGAYTVIILEEKDPRLPVLLALLAGAFIGYLMALFFAIIIGSLPGLYFTLATMAGALSIGGILQSFAIFGGDTGIGALSRGILSAGHQLSLVGVYWFSVAVFAIIFGCLTVFRRSRYSELARASKAGSPIAEAVGFSSRRMRIQVMGLSGLITGIAGALYAITVQSVDPSLASIQTSLSLLAIVVLGGSSLGIGPIIGAALVEGAPIYLPGGSTWGTVIVGGTLVAALMFYEYHTRVLNGVILVARPWLEGREKKNIRKTSSGPINGEESQAEIPRDTLGPEDGRAIIVSSPVSDVAFPALFGGQCSSSGKTLEVEGPVMQVESLTVSYNGVIAVNEVSLQVLPRQIHAIIGPNGAGKSSLLGAMSGMIPPASGGIIYGTDAIQGKNVKGRPKGAWVSRTFQTPHLVEQLTIRSNIAVGCAAWAQPGMLGAFLPPTLGDRDRNDVLEQTDVIMAMLGLSEFQGLYPELAPIGVLRMAEVARCIATRASVVLLDEPTAGLGPSEKQMLVRLLEICSGLGIGIVLVEHDMSLVAQVADRVTVMASGSVLAEGTVEEVWKNSAVLDVYLEGSHLDNPTGLRE